MSAFGLLLTMLGTGGSGSSGNGGGGQDNGKGNSGSNSGKKKSIFAAILGPQTSALPNFASRLAELLPPSWFGTGATQVDGVTGEAETPILNTILAAFAYPLSWIYSLYQYTLNQNRLQTSSGVWIDRTSYDFFGNTLPRRSGESDASYSGRVQAWFSQPRLSRDGITEVVTDVTGYTPELLELWNPTDCGGYDYVMGWDVAGHWGDLSLNNQFLITAYRPAGGGVPNVDGWGGYLGGYDVGAIEYIADSWIKVAAQDAEIYSTIAGATAAGVTAWTAIENYTNVSTNPMLYFGSIYNSQYLPLLLGFYF